MIVLLTEEDDWHADFVAARLRESNRPFLRLHASEFDKWGRASIHHGPPNYDYRLNIGAAAVNVEEIRAVYLRRPVPPRADATERDAWVAQNEWLYAYHLLLCQLNTTVRWVNNPWRVQQVDSKILQLRWASACGLRTLPTLVTCSPREAWQFYDVHRDVVCKPMSVSSTREGDLGIYVACLPVGLSVTDFDRISACPTMLQRWVNKRADVRVAIVDRAVFGCEILSQELSESRIDFRAADPGDVHCRPITLPLDVSASCIELANRMDIPVIEIDFVIDEAGKWFFLEANPDGQWLWMEVNAALPISMAIATLLSR